MQRAADLCQQPPKSGVGSLTPAQPGQRLAAGARGGFARLALTAGAPNHLS